MRRRSSFMLMLIAIHVSLGFGAAARAFTPPQFVQKFGEAGTPGALLYPRALTVDRGYVYVADSGWSNVQIFNPKGQVLLFFGGRGPVPGMMKNPLAVAIDVNNRIYVGDYLNHRIGVYELVNTSGTDSFLNPPSENLAAVLPASS